MFLRAVITPLVLLGCLYVQSVIDANIIPALIDVMGRAEFKTRKEAAWAITNAVSGGSADQIRFLVDQGCIPPLCNLLTVMDGKIVQVALNGLEHILRAGLQESKQHSGVNIYAVSIEECYGTELTRYICLCGHTGNFQKLPYSSSYTVVIISYQDIAAYNKCPPAAYI